MPIGGGGGPQLSLPTRSWGQPEAGAGQISVALMAHKEVAVQPVAIVFALADVPQGEGSRSLSIDTRPESCPCVDHYNSRLSTSLTKMLLCFVD